jgi:hypothetical protein
MLERHEHEKKMKASKLLAQFIQRYRLFFLILGLAVILFPIVYFVVDSISRKSLEDATVKAYLVDRKYDDYRKEPDAAKKAAVEKELFALIDETYAKFGSYYAGARALFVRGTVNYEKALAGTAGEKKALVTSAVKDFATIADVSGSDIIVPLALMQAAAITQNIPLLIKSDTGGGFTVSPEEIASVIPKKLLGDGTNPVSSFEDIALVLFQYIVDNYNKSVYNAEALINIGYLYETKKSFKEAGEIYGKLESEYSNNDWTKVAINRKIKLQADGLLSE